MEKVWTWSHKVHFVTAFVLPRWQCNENETKNSMSVWLLSDLHYFEDKTISIHRHRPWHNCNHFSLVNETLNFSKPETFYVISFIRLLVQFVPCNLRSNISSVLTMHFLSIFQKTFSNIFLSRFRSPQCSPDVESIFRKHRQKIVE